jgi:DNA-binding response OmpR family regulator
VWERPFQESTGDQEGVVIEAAEHFRPTLKAPRPGCDRRCRPILIYSDRTGGRHWRDDHDPDAHEEYGARMANPPAVWVDVVRTGPLTIDGPRSIAVVDGYEIALTERERQILLCLGTRLGNPVPYQTILSEVWGEPVIRRPSRDDRAHLIRVSMTRIRQKLNTAARLLVTRPTIGFELIREVPV